MKLIKNAFTLAEVLVVLAILGVVAALTMPSLQMNANRATVGPSLAKAITTLENANELMLVDNNARSLRDVVGNDYIQALRTRGYVKFEPVQIQRDDYSKWDSPQNPFDVSNSMSTSNTIQAFVSSDNLTYFQVGDVTIYNKASKACPKRVENLPSEFNGACYQVYVDINTPGKGPNVLGKDLFRLFVDGRGSVIADGGNKAITYFGEKGVKQACNRDGVEDGGYSCAGSIVDNGYRVVYPY